MVGALVTCALAGASALSGAFVPRLADALVARKRAAFAAWFEAGAEAFEACSSASPEEHARAAAWSAEAPRLATDGALDASQLARAASLTCVPKGSAARIGRQMDRLRWRIACAALLAAYALCAGVLAPSVIVAALLCAVALTGLFMTLTDLSARIVPNVASLALLGLGAALRVTLGEGGQLAALLPLAVIVAAAAALSNLIHSRRHPGERAIGAGDAKALCGVIVCAGGAGIPLALAAVCACLPLAALARRALGRGPGKVACGPALAAGAAIGAISSAILPTWQ